MTEPRQGALATPRIQQRIETPAGETLTVADAILQIIRAGGTRRAAAAWAGIHAATLSNWISRGLATWEQADSNHDNPEKQATTIENSDDPLVNVPDTERPYVDLAIGVAQSEVAAEMRLVTSVYDAAKDDWRAAVEALRARERGTWVATPRVELTGAGGGPVTHGVAVLDHAGAARIVANLEERRAQQAALPVAEARGA
jgi:hypothetical protein